ncbi:MAG: hypothetical protein FWG85_06610 [Bacteroidetes bacterium]|nr:hypothetical protein [Bacteroidota bacterium]
MHRFYGIGLILTLPFLTTTFLMRAGGFFSKRPTSVLLPEIAKVYELLFDTKTLFSYQPINLYFDTGVAVNIIDSPQVGATPIFLYDGIKD